MTKEWVERKERERRQNHGKLRKQILDQITEAGFTKEEAERIKKDIVKDMNGRFFSRLYYGEEFAQIVKASRDESGNAVRLVECFDKLRGLTDKYVEKLQETKYSFIRYQDSEPMEFDGDIIITDPCYILNHGSAYDDDWEKCY